MKVAQDEVGEVWICGSEGSEELLEVAAELRALLHVVGVGFLDCIDIEDGKGVFGAKGKGGGLDAAIAVGAMG